MWNGEDLRHDIFYLELNMERPFAPPTQRIETQWEASERT